MSRTLPSSERTAIHHAFGRGVANQDVWVKKVPLPNDLTFFVPSDTMLGAVSFVVKEIFGRKRYGHPGFELRPTDTVVDVGANMGVFVLWAAPQVPQGRVLAIEPTSVMDCLEMNVRQNGLTNVVTARTAVGRTDEPMEFVEHPGFNLVTHQAGAGPVWLTRFFINLLYRRYQHAPVRVTVPCAPLASILDECGIETVNLLKMDCEGGEYEIFRGMKPEHWRRIERIAMEFHELSRDQRCGELIEILDKAGFEIEVRKPFLDYYLMRFGEIWARRKGTG